MLLEDATERLSQYEAALTYYIEKTSFKYIVFVENSGYPFNQEKYRRMAAEYGKEFEFLYRFLDDEMNRDIKLRGKSLGEMDLLSYAVQESKLIHKVEFFYKVTGRCRVKNIDRIIASARNVNEFISFNRRKWTRTVFFKMSKSDFLMYMLPLMGQIQEDRHMGIETVWYQALKRTSIKSDCFWEMPHICGTIGGTGKNYEKGKAYYFLANVLCKLHVYKVWKVNRRNR